MPIYIHEADIHKFYKLSGESKACFEKTLLDYKNGQNFHNQFILFIT